jgi:predicted aldo/keto reductase-like oxidoreductase
MNYLGLEYVDLLSLHGINNRQLLDWSMKKNGCLAAARRLQKEGAFGSSDFPLTQRRTSFSRRSRAGNLITSTCIGTFVNDLNWATPLWPRISCDMGVFIISPNDKGGKLYDPPPKLSNCAPRSHPCSSTTFIAWLGRKSTP